jgi:hypothetical protein
MATVAQRGSGLIADVKARPDARLLRVPADHRDGLPEALAGWMQTLVQRT